jgi:hypothetical protein
MPAWLPLAAAGGNSHHPSVQLTGSDDGPSASVIPLVPDTKEYPVRGRTSVARSRSGLWVPVIASRRGTTIHACSGAPGRHDVDKLTGLLRAMATAPGLGEASGVLVPSGAFIRWELHFGARPARAVTQLDHLMAASPVPLIPADAAPAGKSPRATQRCRRDLSVLRLVVAQLDLPHLAGSSIVAHLLDMGVVLRGALTGPAPGWAAWVVVPVTSNGQTGEQADQQADEHAENATVAAAVTLSAAGVQAVGPVLEHNDVTRAWEVGSELD